MPKRENRHAANVAAAEQIEETKKPDWLLRKKSSTS